MPLEQEHKGVYFMSDDNNFEQKVSDTLISIDARLSLMEERLSEVAEQVCSIDEKLAEATGFASDLVGDGEGLFGEGGMDAIRETLSSFVNPTPESFSGSEQIDVSSLQDLVGSLQDFRSRLTGIKEAISDLPTEPEKE